MTDDFNAKVTEASGPLIALLHQHITERLLGNALEVGPGGDIPVDVRQRMEGQVRDLVGEGIVELWGSAIEAFEGHVAHMVSAIWMNALAETLGIDTEYATYLATHGGQDKLKELITAKIMEEGDAPKK